MEGSIRKTKGNNADRTGEHEEKHKIRSQGQANKSTKMSRNKKERDAGKQWKKNKNMPTHRLRPVHALAVREWQSRLSGPSCLYRFRKALRFARAEGRKGSPLGGVYTRGRV